MTYTRRRSNAQRTIFDVDIIVQASQCAIFHALGIGQFGNLDGAAIDVGMTCEGIGIIDRNLLRPVLIEFHRAGHSLSVQRVRLARVIERNARRAHRLCYHNIRIGSGIIERDIITRYEDIGFATGRLEVLCLSQVPNTIVTTIPYHVGSIAQPSHINVQLTFLVTQHSFLGTKANLDVCHITDNRFHISYEVFSFGHLISLYHVKLKHRSAELRTVLPVFLLY